MRLPAAVLLTLLFVCCPQSVEAASPSKAVARAAARSLASRARTMMMRTLRKDLVNHRVAPIQFARPRTVFRYTSRGVSKQEALNGVPPFRHMTSTARPGRPLSALNAQRRFGLPQRPTARETVRIPSGQPIVLNKAQGGRAGVGEIVSPAPVRNRAITKVVPLR